jgi:hypothetical protein
MVGLKVWLHTYADALHSVRTGQPSFQRATGAELFDYLAPHPAEAALFNEAMSDFGKSVAAAVTHAYDFSGIRKIMDVGGWQRLVRRRHPRSRAEIVTLMNS